jgi:hypothetical protein
MNVINFLKEKSKLKFTYVNKFPFEVRQYLYDYCSETDDLKILFYMWKQGIKKIPTCQYPNCNNKVKFDVGRNKFNKGCCREHSKKITNLEKYGAENPMQSETIKEKLKQTFIKKYGVKNPMQSKEIQEKVELTNLKKYGVKNPMQLTQIREKIKQTNLKKYGVKNPMQSERIRKKLIQINIKKYGANFPFQSKQIREKIKQTNLKKYGVENPMKSERIKRKIYQANYTYKTKILKEQFDLELLNLVEEYNGIDNEYQFKCLKCGNIFKSDLNNGKIPSCPICNPKLNGISKIEVDLFKNINYPNKIQSDRELLDGFELDIIIPDKRIAIELNGIYWHSELNGKKDKNYHLIKTIKSEKKGYQLLHFWDVEYQNKKEIVLSIINSKLGIFDKRIYARKCEVKEINVSMKDEFLVYNHLQGKDKSKIRLGLFHNDKLISVMTFTKARYNKNCDWEIIRYSTKLNCQVIGGASKLFDYFVKKYSPQSIVTYADRRYSNGNLYEKLGFKFDGYTKPNYYYIKNDKLYSRIEFQKHKLKNKLKIFDENLTEWENMQLNGYDRIWDCGNYRFVWHRE